MGLETIRFKPNQDEDEPNISSALELIKRLDSLDQTDKLELVPEIKEKLSALRAAQEAAPNARNVRQAIANLSGILQKLIN
ncbi:MAG: hypothetical protein AAB831_00475 [Patescibacteria group bacterium]